MVVFGQRAFFHTALLALSLSGCALSKSDRVLKPDRSAVSTAVTQSPQPSGEPSGVVLAEATQPNLVNHAEIQLVAAQQQANSLNPAIVQRAPEPAAKLDLPNVPGAPLSAMPAPPYMVVAGEPAQGNSSTALAQMPNVMADSNQSMMRNTGQVIAQASSLGGDMLSGNYLIESGDSLDIKFRSTPELDELLTVRPDGMISLPIVGDVAAAGMTPEMLRRTLIARYAGELKTPDITVIVRSFSGNNIYVGGEVLAPGRVALAGRITTLNAIILAGGFKDTADQKRVMVRRADGTCCAYDMKSIIECKGGQDIQLQPYDIVYVPKSHIAKVNLFVEQYIDKVLPFSRSFGIFVSHNTGLTSAVGSP